MTQIFQRLNICHVDKKHILWALLETQLCSLCLAEKKKVCVIKNKTPKRAMETALAHKIIP